jgi:hypothetical protein
MGGLQRRRRWPLGNISKSPRPVCDDPERPNGHDVGYHFKSGDQKRPQGSGRFHSLELERQPIVSEYLSYG